MECDELGYNLINQPVKSVNKRMAPGRGRTRVDNSLGELTRKFVNLIKNSKEDQSVDLKEAATKLNV